MRVCACVHKWVTVCFWCLWGVLRCVSPFDVWHWIYKRVGFRGMGFCVCVCVVWFTLHWPPVSHRQKLASLVLMGCRTEEEGVVQMLLVQVLKGYCMCTCICMCVFVCVCACDKTFSKLHSHCAIIRQKKGKTGIILYNGTICFSFVCTVWGSVYVGVCACLCVLFRYLFSSSTLAVGPILLHSSALTLLNTHNLDSLHSINK